MILSGNLQNVLTSQMLCTSAIFSMCSNFRIVIETATPNSRHYGLTQMIIFKIRPLNTLTNTCSNVFTDGRAHDGGEYWETVTAEIIGSS